MRFGGKFLQDGIVNRKLILAIVFACVSVRHQQRNRRALGSMGEVRQELPPALDDSVALPRVGIKLEELRVQFRTSRGIGKFRIQQGQQLSDPRRSREYSSEQWLKPADMMAELFADVPEALENSVELARRCNLELQFGKYYLPAFPVPAQHTLESWIRESAREGLRKRLEEHGLSPGFTRTDYDQRLDTELETIVRMGFAGYFLIVADFIGWAKRHDIPVGPGRGSGAGSLVAWSLGITDLDPLRFDLLFERFLNPERVSMPDFDIDFCLEGRDRVIEYVADAYGRDQVSQIITYGTMAAKAVLRDCGRVLGMPYGRSMASPS